MIRTKDQKMQSEVLTNNLRSLIAQHWALHRASNFVSFIALLFFILLSRGHEFCRKLQSLKEWQTKINISFNFRSMYNFNYFVIILRSANEFYAPLTVGSIIDPIPKTLWQLSLLNVCRYVVGDSNRSINWRARHERKKRNIKQNRWVSLIEFNY